MISNIEKIQFINNRILEIDETILALFKDIDKIKNGMQDPDFSIEKCQDLINDNIFKKQCLQEEINRLD